MENTPWSNLTPTEVLWKLIKTYGELYSTKEQCKGTQLEKEANILVRRAEINLGHGMLNACGSIPKELQEQETDG
jgi:hypothetical protein